MPTVTQIHVNGAARQVNADAARSLLSVLRDDLELTGAKYGCGEGRCGACTVLVDGVPRRACVTIVGAVREAPVVTIEGLEQDRKLHSLQEAFLAENAMQCAYCTSGMIMSAAGLLAKNPEPTTEQVVKFMDGNICRCGTYQRIVAAIARAAATMKEAAHA
jgi:aerobic-type carbon monoxide dehydrogenase small subunit (CoxS/CutS family)